MKNAWNKWKNNQYLWLFFTTSLLFAGLFVRFILGDYAYFYTDMGADTFDINYPLYQLFSKVVHEGKFDAYFMNVGLGMDMSSYVWQYVNPFNFLVVALPSRLIPWGVLLATYLKLMTISIFGYKFFQKLIGHKAGSFLAALVWTFSSYVMLWGQHYGFCTSIAMFTVLMYLVHLYVEEKEKSRNWLLVLWLTLLLFTNYYFLYMCGIFAAGYVLIYLISQKASLKTIVKKLLGLAGMGILGICIGGVCLVPTLQIFGGSSRTKVMGFRYLKSLLSPYKAKWLYAFLGRSFSNNLFGIANKYTGVSNYYELAMIFTSSLFFFAVPYLLSKKKLRVRTFALLILSVVLLIFPMTGKLLTFNESTQRWAFILCFLEALAVGVFVKLLLTEQDRRATWISVGCGFGFTVVGYAVLLLHEGKKTYQIEPRAMVVSLVFVGMFGLLLLLKLRVKWLERSFAVMLTVVVMAELFVSNYPTINQRKSPTRAQVATEYYNDGTSEAVEALKETDDSLYRVAKSYESGSENDGMVQGYNGLSAYLTTNPKALIALKEMYGGTGVSDNFVYFNNDNFLLQSLLGVKYLLANPGYCLSGQNYKLIGDAGGKEIYENENALPFGYLYKQELPNYEIEKMSEIERTLAGLSAFYYTDYVVLEDLDVLEKKVNDFKERGEDVQSLLGYEATANDCKMTKTADGIRISDMTDDPNIVMEQVQDAFGEGAVHTITIQVEAAKKVDLALYYQTEGQQQFSQDQIYIFYISPKSDTWTYTIPGDVTALRLDVSTEIEEVTVQEITIDNCPKENAAFEDLKNSSVEDIRYTDNMYEAVVENSEEAAQMLCVPFLYQKGWKAYLDEAEVSLYNINSGLCGVEIPSGSHQVTLRYEAPGKSGGIYLSLGGLFVYLLIFPGMYYWRRRRKGTKNVRMKV